LNAGPEHEIDIYVVQFPLINLKERYFWHVIEQVRKEHAVNQLALRCNDEVTRSTPYFFQNRERASAFTRGLLPTADILDLIAEKGLEKIRKVR